MPVSCGCKRTAKILSREKHPNSDHLSICRVDPGTGEPLQIVCGAPNCDAGAIVPLATIGTTFKDPDGGKDFTIGKGKLRGVESFGMMCSARELGLSNDHEGLMILPPDTPLGVSVAEMFKCDTVYSLELTQNRPDWLSHWGVARDVYALQGGELGRRNRMSVIFFDKNGKIFQFCRKIWYDFSVITASFDLSFLSVYGNL